MESDKERLKKLLVESVKAFLKDGVKRHNTLAVEGRIRITLDNKDVFLVYVNESSTGVVGGTAANDSTCIGEGFDVFNHCDTNCAGHARCNIGDWRDGEGCKRRQQCKNQDLLNGDSDKRLTRSAKLRMEKHRTSGDGQSTCRLNKGHVCDVCKKVFSQRCLLVRHKLKHNTSRSSGEQSAKSWVYCDICGLACTRNSLLIIHMRAHTGEKPYTCDVCNRAFSQYGNRTEHMHTHQEHKPYACEVCKRAFRWRRSIARHMRTHTGEKTYACGMCKKAKGRVCYCDICGLACADRSRVLRHMRSHTGEKPYICSVCRPNRAFSQNSHLTNHMLTHTGEKPYTCDVCKRAFSLRNSLIEHMRTHTGEEPYACNVCKRAFSFHGYLTVHMHTHTGEKRHTCALISNKCF